MRHNRLFRIIIFLMYLIGGAGISVFIISLFISPPTEIENETGSQLQVPKSHPQSTKQSVNRNSQEETLDTNTKRNSPESVSQTEHTPVASDTLEGDTPENQPKKEKEIRAQIAELESQLTSYDSEIQRLDKLRYEYWDQASEYIENQSDDSYRKIRELEAPLRTGEFSREEEMAIRAAVDQVIDEVNNEIKRLVESGNQASEQLAELRGQRKAIRAELDSLKSLIGEE